MNSKTDVDEYLEQLPSDQREALSRLRNEILNVGPKLEERLSRGVPFFYYSGKRAVGFRSSKNHLSFFIMEGDVLKSLRKAIAAYDTSSTVIRFSVKEPLSKELIRKLVMARIAEIEGSIRKKTEKKVR